jgi:hypothetical protein
VGADGEAVDGAAEVARGEVRVELGGGAWIRVAHDPLDGREISARHDEQRGGGVPDVTEPERAYLANGPELHLALWTPPDVRVGRELSVATSFAPAALTIAREDLRAPERASQNLFELHSLGHPAAVRSGKNEVGRRGGDRCLQVGQQLGRDRDGIGMTSLRCVVVVRIDSFKTACRRRTRAPVPASVPQHPPHPRNRGAFSRYRRPHGGTLWRIDFA